jgi:EAL domain-containing protein (putative c-di-GMP-specific phosphodiesterase class I)
VRIPCRRALTAKQFPLNAIKIDRSFVRDAASIAADKDLTAAIIAIAGTLGQSVVAQCVESKEQGNFIWQNASDELQGYYHKWPERAAQMNDPLPFTRNAIFDLR